MLFFEEFEMKNNDQFGTRTFGSFATHLLCQTIVGDDFSRSLKHQDVGLPSWQMLSSGLRNA